MIENEHKSHKPNLLFVEIDDAIFWDDLFWFCRLQSEKPGRKSEVGKKCYFGGKKKYIIHLHLAPRPTSCSHGKWTGSLLRASATGSTRRAMLAGTGQRTLPGGMGVIVGWLGSDGEGGAEWHGESSSLGAESVKPFDFFLASKNEILAILSKEWECWPQLDVHIAQSIFAVSWQLTSHQHMLEIALIHINIVPVEKNIIQSLSMHSRMFFGGKWTTTVGSELTTCSLPDRELGDRNGPIF